MGGGRSIISFFLGEGIATLVTNSDAKVRNFFELTKFFRCFNFV